MAIKRLTVAALTWCAVALAVVLPVVAALMESNRQGLEAERRRALDYALDIVRHSEHATEQINEAFTRTISGRRNGPCSERSRAPMQDVDVVSSHIQAIGYVVGDRLVCSSMGVHEEQIPLGPVDFVTPAGLKLRVNVTFPFARRSRFIVVERDGYAAVVRTDLLLEATTAEPDVNLGAFVVDAHGMLTQRGAIKASWLEPRGARATFVDDGYVVAVARSTRFYTGAVVAVPIDYVNRRVLATARLLVPVAVFVGVVLGAVVIWLFQWQRSMPAQIASALRRDEFFLVYEPFVELETGAWVGAEALIRWRRADGCVVKPDQFIPAAEDSGMIHELTERVIRLVERDAAALFAARPDFRISINVSSSDFQEPRVVSALRALGRSTAGVSGRFMVEVTERGLLRTDAASAVIHDLRGDGIVVGIDDFGTGYSCLAYLESLDLDVLKIDKVFIDSIGTGAANSQVVQYIIAMAQALNLRLIAEGVESVAQLDFLRKHRVSHAQGWLFSRPLSASQLIDALKAGSRLERCTARNLDAA